MIVWRGEVNNQCGVNRVKQIAFRAKDRTLLPTADGSSSRDKNHRINHFPHPTNSSSIFLEYGEVLIWWWIFLHQKKDFLDYIVDPKGLTLCFSESVCVESILLVKIPPSKSRIWACGFSNPRIHKDPLASDLWEWQYLFCKLFERKRLIQLCLYNVYYI